jgi:HPt (histidine-containing phosphotransfer) domain-containing protein
VNELQPVIAIFAVELKEQAQRLKTALSAQQLKGALLEAHSIKGSAGSLGFPSIELWAYRVEEALKSNPAPNPELCTAIGEGLDAAVADVEAGAKGIERRASMDAFIAKLTQGR